MTNSRLLIVLAMWASLVCIAAAPAEKLIRHVKVIAEDKRGRLELCAYGKFGNGCAFSFSIAVGAAIVKPFKTKKFYHHFRVDKNQVLTHISPALAFIDDRIIIATTRRSYEKQSAFAQLQLKYRHAPADQRTILTHKQQQLFESVILTLNAQTRTPQTADTITKMSHACQTLYDQIKK